MKTLQLATIEDLHQMESKIARSFDELKSLLSGKVEKKRYLKSTEACSYLNISYGKLKKLRIDGILNPSKIGKEFYFSLTEINALLEKGDLE